MTEKMMWVWRSIICSLTLAFMLTGSALPVRAGSITADSAAPEIESVEYEGKGIIDVEFIGRVQYKSVKVKVTDAAGKKYSASIVDKDSDDITFSVKKAKSGTDYTFIISGIRSRGAGKYTSVKGAFRIAGPKEVLVENVEYDARDREVSFDFQGRVSWKNPKVVIRNAAGKNCVKKIDEAGREELEVKVKKLTPGETYTYQISGVSRRGKKAWKTVTGSFTV